MAQDLHSYIGLIQKRLPDKLLEINKIVKPKFEVCALCQKFETKKEYPTLLFTNVDNLKGEYKNKLKGGRK